MHPDACVDHPSPHARCSYLQRAVPLLSLGAHTLNLMQLVAMTFFLASSPSSPFCLHCNRPTPLLAARPLSTHLLLALIRHVSHISEPVCATGRSRPCEHGAELRCCVQGDLFWDCDDLGCCWRRHDGRIVGAVEKRDGGSLAGETHSLTHFAVICARTQTHTHARTHTHIHTRAHTHAHAHTH
jgi:hypothetical protein